MTLRLFFGDTTDNDAVSLYRETDGHDVLIRQGAVDAEGKVAFIVDPSRTTSYIAKWEGDSTHPASTSAIPVLIQVHAVTSGNFGLKDKGAVTVGFYTQAVEKYRVRTSFRGDKDHLKDVSPWAYFRTTN
jgi:hypothetical protein